MPCTGSLKSGDSIMLSCLSPRRPCCGPKAAVILMSPQAASASSECVRSAVTEAGCASSATRRPASGARKAGSAIRRSMPNFMTARPEKIHAQNSRRDGSPACRADAPTPNRTCGRSGPRSAPTDRDATRRRVASPAGDPAPARLAMCSESGPDRTSIGGRADLGRHAHAAAVAVEPIGRPLRRRRKVEFVIRRPRRGADKGLEAGVLPKLVRARGRHDGRQADVADLAGHDIGQHQTICARPGNLHFDARRAKQRESGWSLNTWCMSAFYRSDRWCHMGQRLKGH